MTEQMKTKVLEYINENCCKCRNEYHVKLNNKEEISRVVHAMKKLEACKYPVEAEIDTEANSIVFRETVPIEANAAISCKFHPYPKEEPREDKRHPFTLEKTTVQPPVITCIWRAGDWLYSHIDEVLAWIDLLSRT